MESDGPRHHKKRCYTSLSRTLIMTVANKANTVLRASGIDHMQTIGGLLYFHDCSTIKYVDA